MSKLTIKTLKIIGMHCVSCAMNIDFELEDLPGVSSAKTSYAKQVSEVAFDQDKVTEEEILNTIAKTGYKAQFV